MFVALEMLVSVTLAFSKISELVCTEALDPVRRHQKSAGLVQYHKPSTMCSIRLTNSPPSLQSNTICNMGYSSLRLAKIQNCVRGTYLAPLCKVYVSSFCANKNY
jgi:hypothetical protein